MIIHISSLEGNGTVNRCGFGRVEQDPAAGRNFDRDLAGLIIARTASVSRATYPRLCSLARKLTSPELSGLQTIVKFRSIQSAQVTTGVTGARFRYGDGCVTLDLSRMDRLLDIDAELGLVTLEPGVTQKQLFDYLSSRNLNFFVPTTGAGPTASLVGNALERGFGHRQWNSARSRAQSCVPACLSGRNATRSGARWSRHYLVRPGFPVQNRPAHADDRHNQRDAAETRIRRSRFPLLLSTKSA